MLRSACLFCNVIPLVSCGTAVTTLLDVLSRALTQAFLTKIQLSKVNTLGRKVWASSYAVVGKLAIVYRT